MLEKVYADALPGGPLSMRYQSSWRQSPAISCGLLLAVYLIAGWLLGNASVSPYFVIMIGAPIGIVVAQQEAKKHGISKAGQITFATFAAASVGIVVWTFAMIAIDSANGISFRDQHVSNNFSLVSVVICVMWTASCVRVRRHASVTQVLIWTQIVAVVSTLILSALHLP